MFNRTWILCFGLAVIHACGPRGAIAADPKPPVLPMPTAPIQSGHAHTNRLAREKSPYLLQHQHNPVDWNAWGEEAFALARKENKPIFLSIGYSTCHWCHVMERESFENAETAALMNERFICIKVDREERPDIDQVYMNAVQLITGQGGWPLNCFTLPDGRPVYGGTYFRIGQWREVLGNLSTMYRNDPGKVIGYAEQLTKGIRQSEWMEAAVSHEPFTMADLGAIYKPWKSHFDLEEGGMNRAPKFPLPNNWQFLLRYGQATGDGEALAQVKLTLDKMAYGGIYDQLGGGFARYSTDELWKAPHFEKMLYDNAQLMELYAEAFQALHDPLYLNIVQETAEFVERELTSPEGVFYSALDADSEGIEGKFYVWSKEELEKVLGDDFPLFREAYNVNSTGYWEDGHYILLKRKPDLQLAQAAGLSLEIWTEKIDACRARLMAKRSERIRPGLDDKTLVSWNALMAKGYVAASIAGNNPEYLARAIKNLEFLLQFGRTPNGGLYRSYKADKNSAPRKGMAAGRFTINGFLEDYAYTAEALIAVFQATFAEKWLDAAKEIADHAILHFRDPISGLFFFTSDEDKPLVARKMEITDNVTPASNSSMAKVLFALGNFYGEAKYSDMAVQMLNQVKEDMPTYGSGYSNWAMLALNIAAPFHEIVIVGPECEAFRRQVSEFYAPNKLLAGGNAPSTLSILKDRFIPGQTLVYVCKNRICGLPVESVDLAMRQLGVSRSSNGLSRTRSE